jgi:hypothetical protein
MQDATVTVTIHPDKLDGFRTMLREQLAGDHELIRDAQTFGHDLILVADAWERVSMVDHLADQVGGL